MHTPHVMPITMMNMTVVSMANSMARPMMPHVRKQMVRPFHGVHTFQRVPPMPAADPQQRDRREKHPSNQTSPINLKHTQPR